MKQILFRPKVAALAVMAALAVSCSDYEGYRQPQPSGEGDVEVMIMMNVPAAARTRAMTEADEYSVDHLDVLVFLDNGAGVDETYLYTTHGTDYVADNATTTVKVGFQKSRSGEAHRFVFIANMKDEVQALSASWNETMTKADVMQTLTFDAYPATAATESARAWDSSTPRYLPMWGESASTHVVTSSLMGSALGTIKMLRAVATVDIVLNPDASLDPQGFGSLFCLDEIKVYNVPQKGYAAPDPGKLTNLKADLPTYSTSFSRQVSDIVAYSAAPAQDEDRYGISRLVYIPEAPNTDGAGTNIDDLDHTCLVISGYYDGSPDLSWYRLDFIDKLSATENVRYDILRNHRYTFYITAVEGPGYPDEETAFKSAPLNLDTEVLVWDEEDMPDIVFDGNYAFRVNPPDSVVMYKEGSKKYITVKTDHPGGWDIDLATMPDFISNHWIEPGIDRDTLYFEATPITNTVELDKEGYITFLSGKLRKKVKIIQLNEPELTIEIYPRELVFRKGAPNPKSVTITVYPETSTIYFSQGDLQVPNIYPIASWVNNYGPTYYDGFPHPGYPYQFQPAPNNSDDILGALITVAITDGNGTFKTEQFTIRQIASDLYFKILNSETTIYPGAEGNRTFTVDSDARWCISSVDPLGAIQNFDDDYQPAEYGYTFHFEMLGNPNFYNRYIDLGIESDDPEFTPRTERITQGFVNPYIYLGNTNVTTATLDLGNTNTGASQTIAVRSNALWSYSNNNATNWGIVVNSASASTGGSTEAHREDPGSITFTPKTYNAAAGTPAAGTYPVVLTFASTNHNTPPAAANPASATLTVNRTVPAYFALTSTNTSIVRGGGNVAVSANTNAYWRATPTTGTASTVQTAGTWGSKSTTVEIPANTTWSTSTSAVNRTVTINTAYGLTNSLGTNGTSFTVSQPGYYISGGTVTSTTTPTSGEGGSATIRINGDYGNTLIQSRNGTTVLAQNTVLGGTANQAAISIPKNDTDGDRNVTVGYVHPSTQAYHALATYTQTIPESFSVSNISVNSEGIGTITFTGYWKNGFNVWFEGQDWWGVYQTISSVNVPGIGSKGSRTVGISRTDSGSLYNSGSWQIKYIHPLTGEPGTITGGGPRWTGVTMSASQ